MNPLNWFDAHLDLACMAVNGRDMLAPLETCGGPCPPPSITLGSLAEGNVTRCLGTIFTEAGGKGEDQVYPLGDAEAAHAAGARQLRVYEDWRRKNIGPRLSILMECADPIRTPTEMAWWHEQGVVAVGLAWMHATRHAGGNGSETGLTDEGRALVREMDRLGVVHDASHLSDKSFYELCAATDAPIIASHSNCRALMAGDISKDPARALALRQRHLTDDQIRQITRRGGVIGLNLFSRFLRPNCEEPERAGIDDCVRHIEHVCTLAGSRRHVGLGSDADGGFSAARLPEGINRPRDYVKLTDALRARGWSDADLRGFAFDNWARIFP